MSDRDRADLQELMENFFRTVYTRWREDEEMLELVRRQLEDLLISVENNLA